MTRFKQLSMYSSNSFNSRIKKTVSLLTMFAMLAFTGAPLVTLAAAPTYSVNIVGKTVTGLTLNLSGVASSTKFAGGIGSYAVTVTDWGDGSAMTQATSNFTVTGDDFTATWNASHTYTTSGTRTVVVKLHHSTISGNEGSGDSTDTEIIVIPPPNGVPTADNKTLTTNEDTAGSVILTGTDPENSPLTFNIVTNPTHGTLSLTGSNVLYTPNTNYNGIDLFTYRANDGVNNSAPATVSITVSPVNDSPVLTGVPAINTTILEEVSYSFILGGSDIDGDQLTYSATGIPSGASFDPNTMTFTWTPNESQGPGSYNFTVSVNDGVATTTSNVSLNVSEVNVSPILNPIGNQNITEGGSLTFTISGADSDFPTQGLTYSATNLPTGASFDPNTMTFSWAPSFEQAGNYSVTFTVSDGTLSDSEIVPISVGNVNRTPELNLIPDQTINEETLLTVNISGTDADSDQLTYSATNLPSGATFVDGVFSWTPNENQDGIYTVSISVSDGNSTDSQDFVIKVLEVNLAPAADAKTLTINEDTTGNVTLTGTDPDNTNQTLGFTIVDMPDNGNIVLVDGVVTYTPNTNYNGTDSFTYTVNDGSLVSNTATVSITVSPINDAPTISLIGETTMTVNQDSTFIDPGATCADIDSEVGTASVTGNVITGTPGIYTLTYSCNDGELTSTTVTRTVTVSALPVNNKPVITLNGNPTINLTAPEAYTEAGAVCTDIDGGQTTLVISGEVNTAVAGTYTITYNCKDSTQLSADPVVRTVVVNAVPVVVTPPPTNSGGAVALQFLGAPTTGRVLGESTTCGIYLTKFLRKGYKNDVEQVKKVQDFLNKYESAGLPLTGNFGSMTDSAVKKFQTKYANDILIPWGLKNATGIVYQTTTNKINKLMCPELNLGTPKLIPIDQNPEAPKL